MQAAKAAAKAAAAAEAAATTAAASASAAAAASASAADDVLVWAHGVGGPAPAPAPAPAAAAPAPAAAAVGSSSSSSQGPGLQIVRLDLGGCFGRIRVQVTSLFVSGTRVARCVVVLASAGPLPVVFRVSARFLPGFSASGRGSGRAVGNDWLGTRRGMRSAFAPSRNLNLSGHRQHSVVTSEFVSPRCSRTRTARPSRATTRRRGLSNLVLFSMIVRR